MAENDVVHVAAAGVSHRSLVALVASIVVLAGLDLLGAALARRWADHGSTMVLAGGMLVFALLFVVYGKSLEHGELTTVTVGWVVLLQLGVLALDLGHGVDVAPPKLLAIGAILALQAYLIVA